MRRRRRVPPYKGQVLRLTPRHLALIRRLRRVLSDHGRRTMYVPGEEPEGVGQGGHPAPKSSGVYLGVRTPHGAKLIAGRRRTRRIAHESRRLNRA